MKSLSEFDNFYKEHLQNDLKLLEKERWVFVKNIILTSAIFIGLALSCQFLYKIYEKKFGHYSEYEFVEKNIAEEKRDSVIVETKIDSFAVKQWDLVNKKIEEQTSNNSKYFFTAVSILIMLLWVSILFLRINAFKRHLAYLFKSYIIQKIIHFIHPNLEYHLNKSIDPKDFANSHIFMNPPDKFTGEDLVEGELEHTQFHFSEVHAKQKEIKKDFKGKNKAHWSTIFKGIFLIAELPKSYNSTTVVISKPAKAEKDIIDTTIDITKGIIDATLETLHITEEERPVFEKTLQSLHLSENEHISINDPEFEKYFHIYGLDAAEAKEILTPAIKKEILDFEKKTNKEMFLSFSGSKAYLALPLEKELFKPHIFRSNLKLDFIRDYFDYLNLGVNIVQEVDKNLTKKIA